MSDKLLLVDFLELKVDDVVLIGSTLKKVEEINRYRVKKRPWLSVTFDDGSVIASPEDEANVAVHVLEHTLEG